MKVVVPTFVHVEYILPTYRIISCSRLENATQRFAIVEKRNGTVGPFTKLTSNTVLFYYLMFFSPLRDETAV